MEKQTASIFFNSDKLIRNIWWVVIFFGFVALFLFPTIILSSTYGFSIEIWHQVVIIALASLICQRLRQKPLAELIGKIDVSWVRELFIGFGFGALLMILPAVVLTLFGIQWKINEINTHAIMTGILGMVSLVIAEELLFRGFIFQRLIAGFGSKPAQVIIAGLFLLTHLNNPGMTGSVKVLASINIFIASILFGLAYLKTKSLSMPIGIHFMANVAQGTILGFGVSGEQQVSILSPQVNANLPVWISGGAFGIEASIVGLLVLMLITGLTYYKYPVKENI